MSLRSVTVSVKAKLDRVLCDLENHEAVAESALGDLHTGLARAVAELRRMEHHGGALQRELARIAAELELWRTRAKSCTEEERALDCLRRARQRKSQQAKLEERIAAHEKVETRLRQDVRRLTEHHTELRERHRSLRARQATAHAFEIVSQHTEPPHGLVDVFERWETRVTEHEYLVVPEPDELDALEESFASEEERAELRAELDALRGES